MQQCLKQLHIDLNAKEMESVNHFKIRSNIKSYLRRRKLFNIFIRGISFVFIFLIFAMCGKKDIQGSDSDGFDVNSLNKTTWKGTWNSTIAGTNFTDKIFLEFQQSTFLMVDSAYRTDGIYLDTTTGIYTYDHPNVILQATDNSIFSGTISGNQMSLNSPGDNIVVLTKQ